jgi:hypothetical protein
MKNLPIGVASFKKIIKGNYYYADKTRFIKKLYDGGSYYFISRPRRFGKSLFADTLKEAFLGNKDLFKGLYLENNWNWEETSPVILFSFGGGVIADRLDLDRKINFLLHKTAGEYGIEFQFDSVREMFTELIEGLYHKYDKRVVIIVDEYDKPLLDNITDKKISYEIREGLKNIYSVIKDSDAYVKFAFLTGVSKFSKVSLFSGLNNLKDITLDKRYGEICGYTQEDLCSVFEERLEGKDLEKIKLWYDGYNFLGENLYNPFDILLYLDSEEFRNYWFQSATPNFLINIIKEKKYPVADFEDLKATDNILSSFDLDIIELETILFQTGYLTIKGVRELGNTRVFSLSYPNLEVKMSLTDFILQYFSNQVSKKDLAKIELYEIIESNRIDDLKELFYSFFASIPNDWYRKNQLSGYEGYYSSIFYCYFTALGFDVTAEDTTNKGRLDMSVKFENRVYIFEFKVNQLAKDQGRALLQLKDKKYHEKFASDFDEIYLIGVEFDCDERNITCFEWEALV